MGVREELHEQPKSLARLLDQGVGPVRDAATILADPDVDHVVIVARGTSDNAARYAQYAWGANNRLAVTLATPSLFGPYGRPVDLTGAAVVAISQSGASPDLRAVVEAATAQGRRTVAITNTPDSPLGHAASCVVPLFAGEERAVAATKTYSAELLAVAMFAVLMRGGDLGEVAELPGLVARALAVPGVDEAAAHHADADDCVVLGRGCHLATAHEWALKLQELAAVVAQPWSTADFAHGPIAVVDEGFPVLAVSAQGPLHGQVVELVRRLRTERGADTTLVSDADSDAAVSGDDPTATADRVIAIPGAAPEWLTPVVVAPIIQRFAIAFAAARGLDPDEPRALTKVTRTH
ncbi:MAG: SIS domain-containing protein [Nitriliruptorales bacterium]